MPLLSFDSKYRRLWMFPRNIRKITPWKLYQILKVLIQCEDMNMASKDNQKFIYQLLAEAGIKRSENIRDKNPGGMRTYYAQLKCLGLIYPSGKERYNYTIAGDAIADEDNPLQVLQYQLFRHQYPSAYGLGRNVLIDPRMKVKPFLFISKLLHDKNLGEYLTDEEVIIPCAYGHNWDCYELCVDKILKSREEGSLLCVFDNIYQDLYTPRGKAENCLDNAANIANTAMNYMRAANWLVRIDSGTNERKWGFNQQFEKLYQEMLHEYDSFINIDDISQEESFLRAYGRYNKTKDGRSNAEAEKGKQKAETMFIQFRYLDYISNNSFTDDSEDFVAELSQKYGFDYSAINSAISPLEAKKRSIDENNYIDYASSGGEKAEEFEKATVNIMIHLGFDGSYWIGRKRSKANWRGNFPDVLIKKADEKNIGFADTKASSSYSLGHNDMLKMRETYVNSNKELEPESSLKYFLYIAGGFRGNIEGAARQLAEATGIPVTALDARTILYLIRMKDKKGWPAEKIEQEIFKHGGLITSYELEMRDEQ